MQQYCGSNSTNPNYNPPFPENDININNCSIPSKLQDPISNNFLFSFPNSPHIHLEYEDAYNQFLQLFDYHKSIENQTPPAAHNNDKPNQETAPGGGYQPPLLPPQAAAARKRCCKKDRHSKINTARGPRDRRMRLSLEVARKFFDLQDLLGYDKASRTVDWLIKNSTAAIRRLERSNGGGGGSCSFNMAATAHSGSASATSDGCEAVSSPNHSTTTTAAAGGAAVGEQQQQQPRAKAKRRKKIRAARATVERESRRRARERARERTSQKKRLLLERESPTEFDDLNSETQVNTVIYSATWNPSAMYQGNAGIVSHHVGDDEFDCGQAWEAAYNGTAFN